MTRRRFSEREVLETLWHQGVKVPCFRCKNAIRPGEGIEREHIHEVALGGEDRPVNCRYSHKICHAVATNGTPATSAGSSKHRIAKVKRIQRKIAGTWRKPGRKIRSRGFQKQHRPMRKRT